MTVPQYLENINKRYKLGNATEHTFRGDLQQLIESLVPGIAATNEPKRQSCGAPDYILTKKDIPVGFIEAKDIDDKDISGEKKTGNKEQFDRYKASLNNLIFTDYLDFHLYIDGVFKTSVKIAETKNGQVVPLTENFASFENLIANFTTHISQTIKSSKKLAEMMAAKARMLAEVIDKALTSDEERQEDSTLKDQMNAFKQILIHDIKPKEFADIYAQTIAYGMFAARLHDPTLPTFSRQEAAELIPKSNPFLRKLFGYIAGPDIDERIKWIVDGLADVFRATDVATLLKDFGKATQTQDPIIHFYETFLSEYDPKLRKARGVWYTPEPIVNFIVRAVDDILKTEFDLPQGLADTSKTKIKVNLQATDKRYKDNVRTIEEEVHRVQILDPATGTGTFLSEVVKHIHKKFEGQEGIWSNYVENHLVPRLNGFELLMASYAMAHLKLDLLLTETGYKPKKEQRFRIYLTNSLEESHPDTGTLFANWLSAEANEANQVKRDTPVMCIIGNPPYSGESANKGEWIMNLMEDYKKEPGGKEKLKERNPKWINDDYVKFLRFGQHFIEKNGSGVLAFINPHGYLDNPTFRGMRWNLLKTYDKIYTIDLHGNSKKKETALDGSIDQNVFDIMQGVSINIFIKTGNKKANELGKVFHFDLLGKREMKYKFLSEKSINTIKYKHIENTGNNYFFSQKDLGVIKKYEKSFLLSELFLINSVGVVTSRDNLVVAETELKLENRIKHFFSLDISKIKEELNIKENSTWKIANVKANAIFDKKYIKKLAYRPFDVRYIYYDKQFIERFREEVMQNMYHENIGIMCNKKIEVGEFAHAFVYKNITESHAVSLKEINYLFPLYLYPIETKQQSLVQSNDRMPNLNLEMIKTISGKLKLSFTNEKEKNQDSFAPIDVLDYVYAILHNPTYREKYKEFLKIDFPRIPYPKDVNAFWKLVKLGGEIRQIHLLESPIVEKYITKYPIDGNNVVTKIKYDNNKVYINDTQYFDNVPQIAWEFYIGGYQPSQKWLKDRKERELSFDDILHYQKIIVALSQTDKLMKEIDKIEIE